MRFSVTTDALRAPVIGVPKVQVLGLCVARWCGTSCCNQLGMRHHGAEPFAMCPRGQREGVYDSDRFQTRTLRYSLRRVSSLDLDFVNCGTHNPKVGGSNPPPATNFFNQLQAFSVTSPAHFALTIAKLLATAQQPARARPAFGRSPLGCRGSAWYRYSSA
jgi:hypothetical protein